MDSPVTVEELVALVEGVVGSVKFVSDASWPHGESRVIEVRSDIRGALIIKATRQRVKFTTELAAYDQWVGALGPHAPTLIAFDDEHQVLVLSKMNGAPGSTSVATSREAGRLLARFHGAAPSRTLAGFAEQQNQRLASWLDRAALGVLADDHVAFVRDQIAALHELDDPVGVPCHRDYQPRNWLTAQDGTVSVIDFEHARFGPWVEDIQRLWWTEWIDRPESATAFLDGYGTNPGDQDRLRLAAISSLWLLTTVVWADEHDDAAFGGHARKQLDRVVTGAPGPL